MTSVTLITREEAIEQTARSLGVFLAKGDASSSSRLLIVQSLRRAVFSAAPCSAYSLCAQVFVGLSFLTGDPITFKAEIEDALEDIIAMGDIFEMRMEIDGRSDVVLRPAPPAFVARNDGTFIILGIAGDEITPLRQPFTVIHQSGLRSIHSNNVQLLRSELLNLGLIELPERLWLSAPAPMSATDAVRQWKARLPQHAKPERVEGLEILGRATQGLFYKSRCTDLQTKHTGVHIARRTQRYGAKLWCLVDVNNGFVERLVDIRAKDSRTRDCDEAWRLQAAFDATAGTPQSVHVAANAATTTLSFASPLPAWAERRLSFIGNRVSVPRALLAFEVANENAQSELRWLADNLWLACNDEREAK